MPAKTKAKTKVSVIIPVYNTAEYLPKCLNSVINQTYPHLEIIAINDGSTDNSKPLLENYAQKDPRLKIINQKNQGLSAARNAGLKIASGDFITFVDSDDLIEPQMIEKMLAAIEKTHADLAVCSFKELFPNNTIKNFNNHRYPQKVFSTEAALKAMLEEKGFMVSATMKLFPRHFFDHLKFPVGKLHEDVGTTYKLLQKAAKIVFLPDEFYLYVHHENSIINQTFDDRKFDLIELTDKMCDDLDQHFPNLKNTTNERRMRTRFSLLRQIPQNHPRTKELTSYLKTHQTYITKNPVATKADKIALKLALISPRLFKLAYKLFK